VHLFAHLKLQDKYGLLFNSIKFKMQLDDLLLTLIQHAAVVLLCEVILHFLYENNCGIVISNTIFPCPSPA